MSRTPLGKNLWAVIRYNRTADDGYDLSSRTQLTKPVSRSQAEETIQRLSSQTGYHFTIAPAGAGRLKG